MSVYFLRFQQSYKIGFSDDIAMRVGGIIAALPPGVDFVGHMPGDRDVERHLHTVFAESSVRGEWFSETDDLLAFARISLDPHIPAYSPSPLSPRRQEDTASWQEVSDRLREASARRWPQLNHSQRKALLTELLDWRPRRVRSLYDNEKTLSLRVAELEALEELLFAEDEALNSVPLTDEPQPKSKGE